MEDAGAPTYKIQNMPDGINITLIARADEIWDNDISWISQKGVLSDSSGKAYFRIFTHSALQGFELGKTYKIENAIAHTWDSIDRPSIDLDEYSKIVEVTEVDANGYDKVTEMSLERLIPKIDISKGFYYIIAGIAANIVFNEDREKAYSGSVFVVIKPNGYIGILNKADCGYHSIKSVNNIQIAKVENGYDIKVSSINGNNLLINFETVQSVQYRLIPDYPLINNGKIDNLYKEKIKERYPNSSKIWGQEEVVDLLEKFKLNIDAFTLSDIYKRDPSAILSKLCASNAFHEAASNPVAAHPRTKRSDIKKQVLDYIISNQDGIEQNALLEALGIDILVYSRVLRRLEREGLIKREMVLDNGIRSYRISYVDFNELIENSRCNTNSIKIIANLSENLKDDYKSKISAVLDQFPRSYETWTNAELHYLKKLLSHNSLSEISRILKREPNIILNKIIHKKLLEYCACKEDIIKVSQNTSYIISNDQGLNPGNKDYIREIVILANSIKHNGRCIAGKDIKSGEWVRVVPLNGNRAFTDTELYELFGNRKGPELLDIISIAFSNKKSLNYHPEDEYIKSESKWMKTGSVNIEEIDRLVDIEDWVSITTQLFNKTDRIPAEYFDTHKLYNSLQWIKLDGHKNHPVIQYQYKQNKNYYRPRLCFYLNGYSYDLAVTYPEYKILNDDPGPRPLDSCYIAVGLSERNEDDYHYKLVVGVIPIE